MLLGSGYSSVTEPIAETSKLWNLVQVKLDNLSYNICGKETWPAPFVIAELVIY